MFSFGENDLFCQANNPDGSNLRRFQEFVKHIFGISPPLFHGRGIFNYTFGLVPFRKPVHTVGMFKSFNIVLAVLTAKVAD